jgi:hypothetical protein
MKARTVLASRCILLGASSILVAAETATPNPVTGSWGTDDATLLELKLDENGRVSGTARWIHGKGQPERTAVKTGTFDRRTGVLKLQGDGKSPDGTVVPYVIDGKIVGDRLSGRFEVGSHAEPFEFRRYTGHTPEQRRALHEEHKGDFDYLLGDWEFTAHSKQWGPMRGYWSAVRLDEGQILDEYRVVGDQGETYYVTTTLRNYNSALDRWELVGADAASGLQDVGTGRRVGAEMHIEQTFGVAAGRPSVWKIRYHGIQPDRFSWMADRSTDGGKTWETEYQTIEARRMGPARSLGALAPGRPRTTAR